jgi:hypothetical protein
VTRKSNKGPSGKLTFLRPIGTNPSLKQSKSSRAWELFSFVDSTESQAGLFIREDTLSSASRCHELGPALIASLQCALVDRDPFRPWRRTAKRFDRLTSSPVFRFWRRRYRDLTDLLYRSFRLKPNRSRPDRNLSAPGSQAQRRSSMSSIACNFPPSSRDENTQST